MRVRVAFLFRMPPGHLILSGRAWNQPRVPEQLREFSAFLLAGIFPRGDLHREIGATGIADLLAGGGEAKVGRGVVGRFGGGPEVVGRLSITSLLVTEPAGGSLRQRVVRISGDKAGGQCEGLVNTLWIFGNHKSERGPEPKRAGRYSDGRAELLFGSAPVGPEAEKFSEQHADRGIVAHPQRRFELDPGGLQTMFLDIDRRDLDIGLPGFSGSGGACQHNAGSLVVAFPAKHAGGIKLGFRVSGVTCRILLEPVGIAIRLVSAFEQFRHEVERGLIADLIGENRLQNALGAGGIPIMDTE